MQTKLSIVIIILIYSFSIFLPTCLGHNVVHKIDAIKEIKINNSKGNILYTPESSTYTYLIDKNGDILKSWNSNYVQGLAAYLLENGDVLRSDLPYFNPVFFCGGVTGRVERFNWDGDLIWEFVYSNNQHCLHHDIEPMPNGNILMISWEYKSVEEAIQAGRDPNTIPINKFFPDYIIEVEPTGPNSGNIVWEWHVWDHLIQDHDPSKDNYGSVEDHPELIDINFGTLPIFGDWNHINSIDYNEEFDQILLSSRGQSEIWIIDHSTTTEEASGHSGGNYGRGGDLLYRWGNPGAYKRGTSQDQVFFSQHDARWIEEGCPGEGNILVFNNGNGRPGFDYSSVDEIITPVDDFGNYYLELNQPFGPYDLVWSYKAENPTDFFSSKLSGCQRIYDGNTIICDGVAGKIFEVTPEKEIVWEYQNNYPNPRHNDIFKVQYYNSDQSSEPDLDCEGSFRFTNVKAGSVLNGNFQIKNIGGENSLLNWTISSFPSWGTWSFEPNSGDNLTPEDSPINVVVSIVAPLNQNKKFEGIIRIENQQDSEDFDIIPIICNTKIGLKNHIMNSLHSSFLKWIFIFSDSIRNVKYW